MYTILSVCEYTPRKCFKNLVQPVVYARREGDENPHSGVVAETMKLLRSSKRQALNIGRILQFFL